MSMPSLRFYELLSHADLLGTWEDSTLLVIKKLDTGLVLDELRFSVSRLQFLM